MFLTSRYPTLKEDAMALFLAQHRHAPDACPIAEGYQFLAHVSAAMAARYGVAIQAEAVLANEHGLVLILEAPDQARVEEFMEFLTRWGEVQVLAASSAEEAVARGGCGQGLRI